MSESMLEKEYKVYSEKYDIHGFVRDYGVVVKLVFDYEGKKHELGIRRNPFSSKSMEVIGAELIDSYIESLAPHDENRKLQLHYWYVTEAEDWTGDKYLTGRGIVTGHKRLEDSHRIYTSDIQAVMLNELENELIIRTRNSVYHCPLAYCLFNKQDNNPEFIPDYERIKAKYKNAEVFPSIEAGKVLLVLSNFCHYYFHSLYYVPLDSPDMKPLKFVGWPHVGMFQDSYLIGTEDGRIDIRYFPHYQNIEFYSHDTDGRPLYIENIGDVTIYVRTHAGNIKLAPGERKEVCKENSEDEPPALPNGDLYPAGVE